jgi:hypothetical protein
VVRHPEVPRDLTGDIRTGGSGPRHGRPTVERSCINLGCPFRLARAQQAELSRGETITGASTSTEDTPRAVLFARPSNIAMGRGAQRTQPEAPESDSPSRHDSASKPSSSAKTHKREPLVTHSNSSLVVDNEATLEQPPSLQVPAPGEASPTVGASPFPLETCKNSAAYLRRLNATVASQPWPRPQG